MLCQRLCFKVNYVNFKSGISTSSHLTNNSLVRFCWSAENTDSGTKCRNEFPKYTQIQKQAVYWVTVAYVKHQPSSICDLVVRDRTVYHIDCCIYTCFLLNHKCGTFYRIFNLPPYFYLE